MADDEAVRRALAEEVTAWLGGAPALLTLRRLSGGESSACYAFDLTGVPAGVPERLVLRLMHHDGPAKRECAIQNAMAAAGFPALALLRTGSSGSAFGRPFAIMPFVDARDPIGAGEMRRLPEILAETLGTLHALPVDAVRTRAMRGGVDPKDFEVAAVLSELRGSGRPEIARAARWFDANSIDGPTVLCHGDLHARNLLIEKRRVVAVLDWEIAVLGPREYDVARSEMLLRLMPGVGPRALRPLVRLLGRRAARQFLSAYASRVPIDALMLARCRALHALRLVALVRTPGASADGVRRLWQPFERELARRWFELTQVPL